MDKKREIREMNHDQDFARESFLKLPLGVLMIRNALPAVSSVLFLALYQIADAMLVGRRFGPEVLASVNILYPVLAIISGLAVMIGVGGNARIAVLMGAGEQNKASRILGLILALGVGLGVIGSMLVRIMFSRILIVLGTSGTLGIYAGEYLATMFPFFAPMILFFILEHSMRNDGQSGIAALVMGGMAVLNIVLDYVFLFILHMGIGGAALASGLSQSLGVLIFISYFIRKALQQRGGLRIKTPGGGIQVLGAIAANGSSEFFNSLALGVTTFLFNRLILTYVGVLGVAAFSLSQYFLLVGMMVIIGLGNGVQPVISYNYGAGLTKRVHGTLRITLTVALGVGLLCFVAMRMYTVPLAVLFIPDHSEMLAATLKVVGTVSWSMLFIPVGIVLSVFFTALEKAKISFLIAVCRGFVLTVIGLNLFPPVWGEFGIWFTPVFAEGGTVMVGIWMLGRWVRSCGCKETDEQYESGERMIVSRNWNISLDRF